MQYGENLKQYNPIITRIASQLQLDLELFTHEIQWLLGEERINRVTPTQEEFQNWVKQKDGLNQFWQYANVKLSTELTADEIQDIWDCINLTLNKRQRQAFTFQDYLTIAIKSEQKCEICQKTPPEVKLEIDHILPVSKGGSNILCNLRFLCQHHNRSRGNYFRWADVWRRDLP
jgi:HNH endonuclease